MNDTSHSWILPPLRDTNRQFTTPAKFGRWERIGSLAALKTLAADLDVDAETTCMRDLVSVPDCWGHVDTFRMALADESSPFHAGAVVEWRALLALFALSGRRPDIPLRTRPVQLGEIARNGGVGSAFASVLTKVRPPDRLHDSLTWETPVLIYSGDRPVGLLSPATLVAPGQHAIGGPASELPWVSGGVWTDPASALRLTLPDLACLSQFLVTLQQALMDQSLRGDTVVPLLRELKKFINGVDAARETRFPNRTAPSLRRHPLDLDVGGQGFFATLAASFVPDENVAPGVSSEVLVAPRHGLPDGFRGAVIMDPRLASALNRDADTVICWNDENLARHQDDRFRAAQAEHAARAGFIPLMFDDIFTPTLCRISDRRCAAHGGKLENYLLPLRPVMLLLFDNQDLSQAVRLEPDGEGVVVTLQLRLHDTNGTPTDCTIRRPYGRDAIKELMAPQAFLWPNFRSPDWSHYYVYRQSDVKQAYLPACVLSHHTLAERLTARLNDRAPTDAVFAASLGTPSAGTMRRLDVAGTAVLRDLFTEEHAPEAIYCTWSQDRSEMPAGLLILPEWTKPSPHDQQAVVGIDFGTTNTCIYYAVGEDTPKAATFENRVWWPYYDVLGPIDCSAMDEEFFPAHSVDMPFRTLLRQRNLGDQQNMQPVVGARILFATKPATAMEYIGNDGNQRFHLDIKWATQGQREAMQCFLGQAVLMSAAEMVAAGFRRDNVKLHFSYPEAFTATQAENFSLAVAGAADLVGMGEAVRRHVPESVAAANFFRHRGVSFRQPVITIDVGGHTTDVSIWNTDFLWKGSLEFGGRDMLIRFLSVKQHRPFLEKLLVDSDVRRALAEYSASSQNWARYANIIETVVNDPSFAVALRARGPILSDDPHMITLRKTAEISFAGILWYLGCVVQSLRDTQLLPATPPSLTICLGGRGSLLFSQFSGPDTAGSQKMRSIFATSAGLSDGANVKFSMSPASKAEVAYGLTRPESRGRMEPKLCKIPLGDQVSFGSTCLAPENAIQDLLTTTGEPPTTELPEFSKFLALALDTLEYDPYVSQQTFTDLRLRVADRIKTQVDAQQQQGREADAANNALKDVLPQTQRRSDLMQGQPPFVIALKEYILKLAAGELES